VWSPGRKETLVAGLGNLMMSDEGIGPRVVERLMASAGRFPQVDFVEPGSSLMGVVHALAGRRKVILIDCVLMGEPPGTIRRFSPDEVVSVKDMKHLSLHEGDLLSTLELSRGLGEYPGEVVIFGIQPESMEPGDRVSKALQERLESYAEMVLGELGERKAHNLKAAETKKVRA